jgi:hypothetical protein
VARELEYQGVWRYNRHDRKRGSSPPNCVCHNPDCAENLHDVGIWVLQGTLRKLAGEYIVGETEGGAVLDVLKYQDFSADVCCCACDRPQPQLHLEDIVFGPDAQLFDWAVD